MFSCSVNAAGEIHQSAFFSVAALRTGTYIRKEMTPYLLLSNCVSGRENNISIMVNLMAFIKPRLYKSPVSSVQDVNVKVLPPSSLLPVEIITASLSQLDFSKLILLHLE